MIGDTKRKMVTQQKKPSMSLIRPMFQDQAILLDAPGMETLRIPMELPPQSLIDLCK